ncbi:MAG: lysostaphin resistance A-like protein [Halobacteriaceae archaeon]
MAGPAYPSFVGIALVIAIAVVGLARVSQAAAHGPDADDSVDATESLPTGALLVNVLLTHGVVVILIGVTAWIAAVPHPVLGLGPATRGISAGVLGVAAGVVVYLLDEVLTVLARAVGLVPSERLRESLSPSSVGGWVTLFVGVLPVVAFAEELLFRAALVGVATTGLGAPVWLAVAGSSLLFGAAHGVQGPGGVIVTGVLGVALAGVFLASGSLLTVVVAHYLVNVLEFVVHEDLDW